jgi:CheY-like chemotaxis protein
MLNGEIEVESQPGIGSVFTIILPAAPTGALISESGSNFPAVSTKKIKISNAPFDAKQSTILLVEDSEPQIIQLTDILKPEGYNIRVARNGKEALDSVKMMIPDAMILDLMMPEVDGFEVLRSIRNLKETSKIPVLILSAKHVTKEELSFLQENNIHELIQKGDISRSELLQHIRDMVTSSAKETAGNKKEQPVRLPKSAKAHILHIEDNPDNLASVKALLSKNFIITDAPDGPTGLQKAREFVPDLILLDISLPVMDGFTVFDELRKDNRLQNVPVIALTARAMKGDRESLLKHGFDGYISKPVDNDNFEKMINEWLYGK